MPGIFKIGYNCINAEYDVSGDKVRPKDGAKPSRYWHDTDCEHHEWPDRIPIEDGSAQHVDTLSADDAEDAIRKLLDKKNGEFWWSSTNGDENGHPFKKPQWKFNERVDIQIVRVEPVAFTTL